jgi:transcriptional regulator with XRE-family HTH domain
MPRASAGRTPSPWRPTRARVDDVRQPRERLGVDSSVLERESASAASLSQSQLAKKMKTSQSYIARIEGGKVRPSTDALERFAQATRTRLRIIFEPEAAR